MGLKEFIDGVFKKQTADPARQEIQVNGASYVPANAKLQVQMQKIALHLCKDYIASAVGKCEIRTFLKGKEIFGDEYYLWNYAPNNNQTSTEFWREVIYKLYDETEVLIVPVGGSLIIADDFSKTEYAILPAEFTKISRGSLTLNNTYNSTTAIYLTLPENMRPETLLNGVTGLLNSTLSEAVEKYRLEGGERGTYEYDALEMEDENFKKVIEHTLNEDFKTYFSNRNAVIPIYRGTKYSPVMNTSGQKTSIVNDISSLLDQSITTVAQALKIPPVLILGGVADSKTAVENFLTFCIDPLMDMITEGINSVRYGRQVLNGSYVTADTSYIRHTDAMSIAGEIDKLKAAGIFSSNEIRRKIGEPRINEKWADEYTLTKNYEYTNTENRKEV